MLVDRFFVVIFAVCDLLLIGGVSAFASEDGKRVEPIDSTVMFKKIPNDTSNGNVADIFELPDILLPESKDTSDKSSKVDLDNSNSKMEGSDEATVVKDVKLPISIVNIAVPASKQNASTIDSVDGKRANIFSVSGKSLALNGVGQERKAQLANLVDVTKFDVAGISLGMNPEKVKNVVQKLGFSVADVTYSIPNFLKWRYRVLCENNGVLVYEQKDRCVEQLAEAKDQRYISMIVLEKPELKEKIKVSFASNFNKNMAYRIEYIVEGDYSLGTSSRPVFLKREKRKDFWRRVFAKYGMPSDVTELLWTEGYDKPYLRVYMNTSTTKARIILEDISIADSDTYYMYRENRVMPAGSNFSF